MKGEENPFFILFVIIVSAIIYFIFYLRNKWADKENKKRILEALMNAFITNDFGSLYKLEWNYSYELRKSGLKNFGSFNGVKLDKIDTDILSDVLCFPVKPFDEFVMNNFFGGTITKDVEGFKDIPCHHVVFRFYKRRYACEMGTKEFYNIDVEKHYGSPSWYNNEMHYNYGIGEKDFYALSKDKKDVERMWNEVKQYIFNK